MTNKKSDYTDEELKRWIEDGAFSEMLIAKADRLRREYYGDNVYLRGLIEFTNHCKNNCYYCGIRRSNTNVQRYRMTIEEILACCQEGDKLGYRTFVLQGGEDVFYSDGEICRIINRIKEMYPDCAVTLSIGECSRESYLAYFRAGADRYLLREETVNERHYQKLHPKNMSGKNRQKCLWNLKEIGFQVGAGFMVDSPFQTTEDLIQDLRFLQELQPDMIGIGPYLRHSNTPFALYKNGSIEKTLRLISILRILFPYALLPATTALGTIHPMGRELGLKAGANVLMSNLSPTKVRNKYELYDNKICTGDEAVKCRACIERRVRSAGYQIAVGRGDVKRKK